MPPDLNSLPSSRPPSGSASPLQQRPRRISISAADARPSPPSPRSPSLSSLQAAATINAGIRSSPHPTSPSRLERRRSSLINNLNLNDPTMPAPGEVQQSNGVSSANGSPRLSRRSWMSPALNATDVGFRHRQPSLGQLHQELENEQEAQVNRLLHMIRVQQDQIAEWQRQQQSHAAVGASSSIPADISSVALPTAGSSRLHSSGRQPNDPSRANSPARFSPRPIATASASSTALEPTPSPEDFLLGSSAHISRDECAFYQAETQMLTRENQMLKLRIRELERQISDTSFTTPSPLGGGAGGGNGLSAPPATFGSEADPATTQEVDMGAGAKVDSEA